MAVKIRRRGESFFLVGKHLGLSLTVNSIVRLRRYNNNTRLLDIDCELRRSFAEADTDNRLRRAIDRLIKDYGLCRRPVFNGEQLAPIILPRLAEIRAMPEANLGSVGNVVQKFGSLRQDLTERLERDRQLPEVSLSKLLHFIQPESFWILDSRVKTILNIWGYTKSFQGFGDFIKDLIRDHEFQEFKEFIQLNEQQLLANHPIHNLPIYFLKVLDKVLWGRAT